MGNRNLLKLGFLLVFSTSSCTWKPGKTTIEQSLRKRQKDLSAILQAPLEQGQFPESLHWKENLPHRSVYTLQPKQQGEIERLLRLWKPDYAAFVALDAHTGAVLSLVSYARERKDFGNLALRATYPAASVFKIVTATAALDKGVLSPDSEIRFNGRNHTLYKRNVTTSVTNRWTRKMSFRRAFASSVNTVFGKIGFFHLKPPVFHEYATRYLFNTLIPGDLPVQPGHFYLNSDNQWEWAEIASGFNRVVKISPVQGALMAAAVANDGVLMAPHLVSTLYEDKEGGRVNYRVVPYRASVVMTPQAAGALREMMRDTVWKGTARFAFRKYMKKHPEIAFGGKTGSLRGQNPKGTNDWFVGYAIRGDQKIAVAALTVNEKRWRIKSATIASHFFKSYFK